MAKIKSEMAASVLRVDAKEGNQVSEGDTLVVLEAMKMEIPVLADDSGVVSKVLVAPGDVVSEGDLLVETD